MALSKCHRKQTILFPDAEISVTLLWNNEFLKYEKDKYLRNKPWKWSVQLLSWLIMEDQNSKVSFICTKHSAAIAIL